MKHDKLSIWHALHMSQGIDLQRHNALYMHCVIVFMGVSALFHHTPSFVVDEYAQYVERSSAEFCCSQSMKRCHHIPSLVVDEWVRYVERSSAEFRCFQRMKMFHHTPSLVVNEWVEYR